MSLTQKELDWIRHELPDLDFSQATSDFVNEPQVAAYLNHYHIDFGNELKDVSHNFGAFHSQGFKLACHIWRPAKPVGTVFFLHGYTDNVGLMQHAIRELLKHHWAVVAFDLPGHGLSTGERGYIESFDHYRLCLEKCLREARDDLPAPWTGAGQSTGGAIWFNYLHHQPKGHAIKTLVLFAPLVRIYNWPKLRWLLPILKPFIKRTKRSFSNNSHDENFLRFVREQDLLQPPGTPVVWVEAMKQAIDDFLAAPSSEYSLKVITGDADRTVDTDWNMTVIREKFPNADISIFKNIRHQVVNESQPYRKKVFSSMINWLNAFE